MANDTFIRVENVAPPEVWADLSNNQKTAMVDVRTSQEWAHIGRPDLSELGKETLYVEWRQAPDMRVNHAFATQLNEQLAGQYPDRLFFLCRSGARSLEAATTIQEILSSKGIECTCINVAEGFEGDPGPSGARGTVNGWQYHQLPWQTG